jgi:hypothetical protein
MLAASAPLYGSLMRHAATMSAAAALLKLLLVRDAANSW